jgi:hypothetical protein
MKKSYLFKTISIFGICLIAVFFGSWLTCFLENRELHALAGKSEEEYNVQKVGNFRLRVGPGYPYWGHRYPYRYRYYYDGPGLYYSPGYYHLVNVNITVMNDDPHARSKVLEVFLDGYKIPMGSLEPFVSRERKYFALRPGLHYIEWTVENKKLIFPEKKTLRKEFRVYGEDVWIHIIIKGEQIEFS